MPPPSSLAGLPSYCVMLNRMHAPPNIASLHARFEAPIAALDCGARCSPYNERGVPFCCDTRHAVPSAYQAEWEVIQVSTDLWHTWQGRDSAETAELTAAAPEGQVLLECLGHRLCQRGYRLIACRAFPFFPYVTREGQFIGLSYYWEYEDRCWVISNLHVVTPEYIAQFAAAFDELIAAYPDELENFRQHSIRMRRSYGRRGRAIPLLHRNGKSYKVTPGNGRLRRLDPHKFALHGPYAIAARLPFPGEE